MRVGERAARVHRKREEGDEPDLRVQEAKLARLGPGRLNDDPPERLSLRRTLALENRTGRRGLGQRLEVGLHGVHIGQRFEDLVLHRRGDVVCLLEGVPARELEMEGDLGAAADLEHDDVVHLAHTRLAQRGRVGALADRLRFLGLDMDHHVGSGHGLLNGPLDGVRRRVALLDRGAVGNPDDDVGEVAPGRSPHSEPAQLYSGLELLDRRERRLAR